MTRNAGWFLTVFCAGLCRWSIWLSVRPFWPPILCLTLWRFYFRLYCSRTSLRYRWNFRMPTWYVQFYSIHFHHLGTTSSCRGPDIGICQLVFFYWQQNYATTKAFYFRPFSSPFHAETSDLWSPPARFEFRVNYDSVLSPYGYGRCSDVLGCSDCCRQHVVHISQWPRRLDQLAKCSFQFFSYWPFPCTSHPAIRPSMDIFYLVVYTSFLDRKSVV